MSAQSIRLQNPNFSTHSKWYGNGYHLHQQGTTSLIFGELVHSNFSPMHELIDTIFQMIKQFKINRADKKAKKDLNKWVKMAPTEEDRVQRTILRNSIMATFSDPQERRSVFSTDL